MAAEMSPKTKAIWIIVLVAAVVSVSTNLLTDKVKEWKSKPKGVKTV